VTTESIGRGDSGAQHADPLGSVNCMTEPFGNGVPPIDEQLAVRTQRAHAVDEQLEGLRRAAEASYVGSPERIRFAEAREESELAWAAVADRVAQLRGLTDDLRDDLTNEA